MVKKQIKKKKNTKSKIKPISYKGAKANPALPVLPDLREIKQNFASIMDAKPVVKSPSNSSFSNPSINQAVKPVQTIKKPVRENKERILKEIDKTKEKIK